MSSKKEFTNERYEQIKTLLSDNKITSSDLDKYMETKKLRHQRYQQLNTYTDEEIMDIVNAEPLKPLNDATEEKVEI